MPFTYLLKCSDGTLYCGSCVDMEKRLKQHNGILKGGAKYTRGRRPVMLVYQQEYATLQEALQREIHIKKLSREEKMLLLLPNKTRTIAIHGTGKNTKRGNVSQMR